MMCAMNLTFRSTSPSTQAQALRFTLENKIKNQRCHWVCKSENTYEEVREGRATWNKYVSIAYMPKHLLAHGFCPTSAFWQRYQQFHQLVHRPRCHQQADLASDSVLEKKVFVQWYEVANAGEKWLRVWFDWLRTTEFTSVKNRLLLKERAAF